MPIDTLPRLTADSRRHVIARALRDAIVTGEFQPGDRLVERDIAERMNISRGPVREALRQLEQEGLVISYPYRGTEVASISPEEIAGVLVPIRLVLERFAVGQALPRLTAEDFDELESLIDELEQAVSADDRIGMVEPDIKFHELLIERAEQPQCLQIWKTIAPRVRAHFYRDAPRHKRRGELPAGHRALLDELRTGDPERVDAIFVRHIEETFTLDSKPDSAR